MSKKKKMFEVIQQWTAQATIKVEANDEDEAKQIVHDQGLHWAEATEANDGEAYAIEVHRESVEDAIARAVTVGKPESKERMKALKAVKWVIAMYPPRPKPYLFAGPEDAINQKTQYIETATGITRIVADKECATVFDGRDNEKMKCDFFRALLRTDCTPELL